MRIIRQGFFVIAGQLVILPKTAILMEQVLVFKHNNAGKRSYKL